MSEVKKVENKNKKPSKFVAFFKKIGRKFKEVFSELKKVTWPDFAKVVKQTGVVLGVVLLFLVFVTLFDAGLQALLKLVTA
ncbi:MAG: preprotein translocase subunit SecE [Clostridiales bacterium]|nr:preprotein translocase subunit SecE [Clostridiales bacterium]